MNQKILLLCILTTCVCSVKDDVHKKPSFWPPVTIGRYVDFKEGDVVELRKGPQRISMFDGELITECQYENRFQFDHKNGSYSLTDPRVEDSGLYTYIIRSKSNRFEKNIYLHVIGPETNIQPVPIGGYPNVNEGSMAAKLCLMNVSDCQFVASYHEGIATNPKYEGRIDFENNTAEFLLRNPTESDSGTYRYTVTTVDEKSEPVTETFTVDLLIVETGTYAKHDTHRTAELWVGVVLLCFCVLCIAFAFYFWKIKKKKESTGENEEEKQNEENFKMEIDEIPELAEREKLLPEDERNPGGGSDCAEVSIDIPPLEGETEENNEESREKVTLDTTRSDEGYNSMLTQSPGWWEGPNKEDLDIKPGEVVESLNSVINGVMCNTGANIDKEVGGIRFNNKDKYIDDKTNEDEPEYKISTYQLYKN